MVTCRNNKNIQWLKDMKETSGQDGGVGRHASPPHTTTERITTWSQNK